MRSLLASLLLVTACSGIDDGSPGAAPDAAGPKPDGHVMDAFDAQMLGVAARFRTFTQVNANPYASTLGAFNIDIYTSQAARDYRRIHPETTGTGVTMPVGTVIVRNVLDAAGKVTKVTLMGKGPKGYDPSLGDWWFGVTDPAGVPLDDGAGPQVGAMVECHSCHLPRAADDFLFGVPRADQDRN
jgi:hypothetical protein